MPANTIVAGGEQACDPHQRGSGQLFAGQLIILDVFPRHVATGYFGDLTRTVLKGKGLATERRKNMWEVCLEGQKRALDAIKPGVEGLKLQEDVRQFFADNGFPTREVNGCWTGFFHGLGHGLGLEVHELPRISHTTFQPGQVFTIEPGLYYPGTGGVRHEDVVVVTEDGYELLNDLPKPFVIP
jgi:Xaa-Pro aminopeptidase